MHQSNRWHIDGNNGEELWVTNGTTCASKILPEGSTNRSGKLTIKTHFGEKEFSIRSINGKLLRSARLVEGKENTIDAFEFSIGVYLLTNANGTKRFVKF